MKNSTVSLMVRNQFNIDPTIEIDVDCLYSTTTKSGTAYTFKVRWIDADSKLCELETTLPQLEVRNQQLDTI